MTYTPTIKHDVRAEFDAKLGEAPFSSKSYGDLCEWLRVRAIENDADALIKHTHEAGVRHGRQLINATPHNTEAAERLKDRLRGILHFATLAKRPAEETIVAIETFLDKGPIANKGDGERLACVSALVGLTGLVLGFVFCMVVR